MGKHTSKLRVRAGDEVVVTAGRDKGKVGRLLRVDPTARKVVVEGVARVKRHTKPTEGRAGGIVEKEMAVDASNVAFWDSERGVRVKIGYALDKDGKKVRVDRKTGESIDE
jgi:large subunit ribosomal protein L24